MTMRGTLSFLALLGLSVSFATGARIRQHLSSSLSSQESTSGLSLCRVEGPDSAGLKWHFGTDNCQVKCKQTIYTKGKINGAFAEKFVASKENGKCHCRDKDTLKDKLPPHTVMNRCGKADCWEYYRNVMSKVVDLPTANFWTADQACPPCGGLDQPKCDETIVDRNFGAYDLGELKAEAQKDTTGKKQQELDVIIDALRTQGILDISSTILTDSKKDAFRWVTAEDLTCSKSCADENGPGVQVGEYVCEKLADGSSSNSWERAGDSECEKEEGPKPELGVCATTVCRAAWTVETDLGSIKEKLDIEVKTVLPEGVKPSPDQPYLVDITDLMPKVTKEGLRCCCDKDKKGFGVIKDVLRGIGDRSNYCALTKESKCGDVTVTADTESAHSYDSTDGKCEILKSTLDELKGMIDITEGELVSAIVEDTWQPCDHKCLEKGETLEDAKQFRSVQCVVENGAGNWEYRSVEACEKLIPGATKPMDSRMCSVPPVPCYKWVKVTQCHDHEGNVMEDAKCAGLDKP